MYVRSVGDRLAWREGPHPVPCVTQHMREMVLNFFLFKTVFVLAVLDPDWTDTAIWATWFAVIGLMKLLAGLALRRFQRVRTGACP